MKLSRTQRDWLEKLRKRDRIRYGAPAAGGMPQQTADALCRLGLAQIEWQRIFRKHKSTAVGQYVVAISPQPE